MGRNIKLSADTSCKDNHLEYLLYQKLTVECYPSTVYRLLSTMRSK